MIPEEFTRAIITLPAKRFGPIDVIAFKHERRDLFRTLMIIVDLWDTVRKDIGEIKTLGGARGMCGVYGNVKSYLPMQIMCVLAAEFHDCRMILVQGVMLIADSREPDASEKLQEFTKTIAEYFRLAIEAKYHGGNVRIYS